MAALALAIGLGTTLPVPTALVLLAAAYASELELRHDRTAVDAAAPLVGAALLVVAELAYWSHELRGGMRAERRQLLLRAGALAALAAGSVVLGALMVTVTAVPLGGGVAWDALGVVAAAGALAIIGRLAWRELQRPAAES